MRLLRGHGSGDVEDTGVERVWEGGGEVCCKAGARLSGHGGPLPLDVAVDGLALVVGREGEHAALTEHKRRQRPSGNAYAYRYWLGREGR